LKDLLRNVLDHHALSLQSAQLTRTRNYDDNTYYITSLHPRTAPEWTFVSQSTPADTDFSEQEQDYEEDEEDAEGDAEGEEAPAE
jgi:hypothetical protein